MTKRKDYQLGLIGWPVGHSFSPTMHQAALTHTGLNGEYRLYPISPLPEGKPALNEILQQVKTGEIDGLNVTIPHKQNVIPLLNELSPAAEAIGAVNTISMLDNRLRGDNTDAAGFMNDLDHFINEKSIDIREKNVLVLGAGGAARAVCYALQSEDWQVSVAARRYIQAESLASVLGLHQALDLIGEEIAQQQPDLIVNTTPAGMHPNTTDSPWPEGIPLPEHAAVYDLVYNPSETQLVRQAKQAGLPATTGLGMLVEQAVLAFQIWTGQQIPSQVMYDALQE